MDTITDGELEHELADIEGSPFDIVDLGFLRQRNIYAHEAGHAVVARGMGISVHSVEIQNLDYGSISGSVYLRPPSGPPRYNFEDPPHRMACSGTHASMAAVFVAGVLAECIWTGAIPGELCLIHDAATTDARDAAWWVGTQRTNEVLLAVQRLALRRLELHWGELQTVARVLERTRSAPLPKTRRNY